MSVVTAVPQGEATTYVMPKTDSQIHVRLVEVTKDLGSFRAVDSVSLEIPKGSMVTLLGPSGCGKSTTLRLLAGFYRPTSGEIYLGEERITDTPPNRRRMTMMFQEYALFPHLSVSEKRMRSSDTLDSGFDFGSTSWEPWQLEQVATTE